MWEKRGTVRPFPNYYDHGQYKIREKFVAEEISTLRNRKYGEMKTTKTVWNCKPKLRGERLWETKQE
jgi:hypothetical protein